MNLSTFTNSAPTVTTIGTALALWLGVSFSAPAHAAPLIMNEFNAVGAGEYLNGGTELVDGDGNSTNPPSDSFFGRIAGNGGDWIELVVVGGASNTVRDESDDNLVGGSR